VGVGKVALVQPDSPKAELARAPQGLPPALRRHWVRAGPKLERLLPALPQAQGRSAERLLLPPVLPVPPVLARRQPRLGLLVLEQPGREARRARLSARRLD
jgi:hypothetical protein